MEGTITRNKGARLVRGGEVIAEGKIDTLRRLKMMLQMLKQV